jgi:catechol 2,3-dioxygenase-like lactoylglutathione lyase family enzyme
MSAPRFLAVNPVLPVYDIREAIRYYTEKLGFHLRFQDDPENPRYVVVERDAVRLHMQWHDPTNPHDRAEALELRFLIDDVDSLFEEYKRSGAFDERTTLADKPWGTREFAFFDPDGNGLFFYRNR